MFPTQTRPVPSKGALRVLYQLAYISSGTVVGAGVLCAEERRRRTKIVQRIADNAKIIRQSPRCIHNTATAQALYDSALNIDDEHWEETSSHRKRRRRRGDPGVDDPYWAPVLPSVVDAEYEHARQRDSSSEQQDDSKPPASPTASMPSVPGSKTVYVNSAPWGLPIYSQQVQSHSEVSKIFPHTRSPKHALARKLPAERNKLPISSREDLTKQAPSMTEVDGPLQTSETPPSGSKWDGKESEAVPGYAMDELTRGSDRSTSDGKNLDSESSLSTSVIQADVEQPQTTDSLVSVTAAVVPDYIHGLDWESRSSDIQNAHNLPLDATDSICASSESQTARPDALTGTLAAHVDSAVEHLEAEQLSQDIEAFFKATTAPLQEQKRTATQLLRLARSHGSLEDIRSLVLWKLANDGLAETEGVYLCRVAAVLAKRFDHNSLIEFYTNLLSTAWFQSLNSKAKARSCLGVFAGYLEMDPAFDPDILFEQSMFPLRSQHDIERVASATATKITRHLKRGQIRTAGNLLWQCGRRIRLPIDRITDDVFSAAISAGLLATASLLLRLKLSHGIDNGMIAQVDTLVTALTDRQAWGMLVSLFDSGVTLGTNASERLTSPHGRLYPADLIVPDKHQISASYLSQESTEKLSTAFGKRGMEIPHYDFPPAVPRYDANLPLKGQIGHTNASIPLKSKWLSTFQLDQVKSMYEAALKNRTTASDESKAELHFEMAEVLIMAGKVNEAIEMMRSITTSADLQSTMLVAFGLAQKAQWTALDDLLSMAQAYKLQWTPRSCKLFDHVLRLYAAHHSPSEIWTFVTNAIEKLELIPNHSLSSLTLKSFVAKGAIELIMPWVRYMKTRGNGCQLTAPLVSGLFQSWYLSFRPPHKAVLVLAQQLAEGEPALVGNHLLDVVKEACGYAARKLRLGSHERDLAYARSSLLSQLTAEPSPLPVHEIIRAVLREKSYFIHSVDWSSEHTVQSEEQEMEIDAQDAEEARQLTYDTLKQIDLFVEAGSLDFERPGSDQCRQLSPSNEKTEPTAQSPTLSAMESTHFASGISLTDFEHPLKSLEREMLLLFSLNDYDGVVRKYHESAKLGVNRSSHRALQITIEASLYVHHGDDTEARKILQSAYEAGMNTTCAMGHILQCRIAMLGLSDMNEINNLRTTVLDYYRANDANSWPVEHHIATSAANKLLKIDRPEEAIELLDDVFQSQWAAKKPFDLATLTIYLRSFAAMKDFEGVVKVINIVLNAKDLRLGWRFAEALKAVQNTFHVIYLGDEAGSYSKDEIDRELSAYRRMYRDRSHEQVDHAVWVGTRLLNTITKIAKEEQMSPVPMHERLSIEAKMFGSGEPDLKIKPVSLNPLLPAEALRLKRWTRSAERSSSHSLGKRQELLDELEKTFSWNSRWAQAYRAFLRRPMVTKTGTLASFRYFDPAGADEDVCTAKVRSRAKRAGLTNRRSRSGSKQKN